MTGENFDDINVTTKTYTAYTNLQFNLVELFNILPITEYVVLPKKRGRKKKDGLTIDPNKDVPFGSIVTLNHEGVIRGVRLKPSTKKKPGYFRNAVAVVMILDKPINIKVCQSGSFQMTGCKSWEHAETCIYTIWEYIRDHKEVYKSNSDNDVIELYIIPSMRNIDFDIGFKVNREIFHKYMDKQTNIFSLLETSFGYTGVIVKFPITNDINDMKIRYCKWENNKWENKDTLYREFLGTLPEQEKKKKLSKQKYNTFLVFHSGRVIFSGMTSFFMRDVYYDFQKLIQTGQDVIKEKLEK